MRTLVVFPTYNECENLPTLLPAVRAVAPEVEFLVVDDNSPDGTGYVVDDIARHIAGVHVLHRPRKEGLARAYQAGFGLALSGGLGGPPIDFVVQMDADFSHRPEDLPRLLDVARGGADVVIGSRNVRGGKCQNWSVARRALSRLGSLYTRLVLRLPVRDATSGFKCWRRAALEAAKPETARASGYAFQIEMNYRAVRAGLQVVEVPICFSVRLSGRSKMTMSICWEAWLLVLRLALESKRAPSLTRD